MLIFTLMITETHDYFNLDAEISDVSHIIPWESGIVRKRELDRKLPKLLEYASYSELNSAIDRGVSAGFIKTNDDQINYYRHRWFIHQCSILNTFTFNALLAEPNLKSSLSIEGVAVINDKYHGLPEKMFKLPLWVIDYLYKQEVRDFYGIKGLRNRLFIVPYSFISSEKEPYLRGSHLIRTALFVKYIEYMQTPSYKLLDYTHTRKSDIIFLVETTDGELEYSFGSETKDAEPIFKKLNINTL